MNGFISKSALNARRSLYKKGLRVELVSMEDPYTNLKPGDLGTIEFVDDIGTIFINWDNGSSLVVILGEDAIKILR
jgi:hypothetical protein